MQQYVAVLDGVLKESEGDINLPIRGDREHRPYQIVDSEGEGRLDALGSHRRV